MIIPRGAYVYSFWFVGLPDGGDIIMSLTKLPTGERLLTIRSRRENPAAPGADPHDFLDDKMWSRHVVKPEVDIEQVRADMTAFMGEFARLPAAMVDHVIVNGDEHAWYEAIKGKPYYRVERVPTDQLERYFAKRGMKVPPEMKEED